MVTKRLKQYQYKQTLLKKNKFNAIVKLLFKKTNALGYIEVLFEKLTLYDVRSYFSKKQTLSVLSKLIFVLKKRTLYALSK